MRQVKLFPLDARKEAFDFYENLPPGGVDILLDEDWMNYMVVWEEEDIRENE